MWISDAPNAKHVHCIHVTPLSRMRGRLENVTFRCDHAGVTPPVRGRYVDVHLYYKCVSEGLWDISCMSRGLWDISCMSRGLGGLHLT